MLTYGTREQLFFGAHKPFAALLDISCLTPLVYTLTAKAYKLDYRTAYVFVPYCAWLTYATYLNGETSRKARACDNSSSESHPLMHARTFPLTSNDRSRLLVAQRRQGQGGAEEEGPLRRIWCCSRRLSLVRYRTGILCSPRLRQPPRSHESLHVRRARRAMYMLASL